jgi:hypothetical protein
MSFDATQEERTAEANFDATGPLSSKPRGSVSYPRLCSFRPVCFPLASIFFRYVVVPPRRTHRLRFPNNPGRGTRRHRCPCPLSGHAWPSPFPFRPTPVSIDYSNYSSNSLPNRCWTRQGCHLHSVVPAFFLTASIFYSPVYQQFHFYN